MQTDLEEKEQPNSSSHSSTSSSDNHQSNYKNNCTSDLRGIIQDHFLKYAAVEIGGWLPGGCDVFSLLVFLWQLLGSVGSSPQLMVVTPEPHQCLQRIKLLLAHRRKKFKVISRKMGCNQIEALLRGIEIVVFPPSATSGAIEQVMEHGVTSCEGGITSLVVTTAVPTKSSAGAQLRIYSPRSKNLASLKIVDYSYGVPLIGECPELIRMLFDRGNRSSKHLCCFDKSSLPISNLSLGSGDMQVFCSVLDIVGYARCRMEEELEGKSSWQCEQQDYEFTKRLLQGLSVIGSEGSAFPHVAAFAEALYQSIGKKSRKRGGEGAFSRPSEPEGFSIEEAALKTGLVWNTAKKHLAALEKAGTVESRQEINKKTNRKAQLYWFVGHDKPSFGAVNPFLHLPDIDAGPGATEGGG